MKASLCANEEVIFKYRRQINNNFIRQRLNEGWGEKGELLLLVLRQ